MANGGDVCHYLVELDQAVQDSDCRANQRHLKAVNVNDVHFRLSLPADGRVRYERPRLLEEENAARLCRWCWLESCDLPDRYGELRRPTMVSEGAGGHFAGARHYAVVAAAAELVGLFEELVGDHPRRLPPEEASVDVCRAEGLAAAPLDCRPVWVLSREPDLAVAVPGSSAVLAMDPSGHRIRHKTEFDLR